MVSALAAPRRASNTASCANTWHRHGTAPAWTIVPVDERRRTEEERDGRRREEEEDGK